MHYEHLRLLHVRSLCPILPAPHTRTTSLKDYPCLGNIFEPEVPPLLVVVLLRDSAIKHFPAPLIDEVAEGDEGHLVQRHLHQEVDVFLCQGKGSWSASVASYSSRRGRLGERKGWAGLLWVL